MSLSLSCNQSHIPDDCCSVSRIWILQAHTDNPHLQLGLIFSLRTLLRRLSQIIREQKGLTYGVYSYLQLDDKAPLIVVGFSATKDKFAEADKLFEEQWREFGKNGITQEELDKAKKYLTASNNLRFVSIKNISVMLTAMQKYNLGLDFLQKRNEYINQISLEKVNQVIKKYFVPQMISVEIGSF